MLASVGCFITKSSDKLEMRIKDGCLEEWKRLVVYENDAVIFNDYEIVIFGGAVTVRLILGSLRSRRLVIKSL